jgi:hypothetical protein
MHSQYPDSPILTPTVSVSMLHTVPHSHRLYLNIAPRHHTCHRPQCAVPLSITLRAVHSSHYVPAHSASAGRVQCAVGDTAARQLPSPRTAPCHRVFAAPGFVLPANSSLTPTAFPSRLSRAAGRSPCLQRRLCLTQSQHHKRRLSFTKLTAPALRVGEHGDGLRGASSARSVSCAAFVLLFWCSHLLH